MNNNIYSGNQHHKNCFSDGSCKTLKYKVYNSIYINIYIYSMRAYINIGIWIYMINQKNYESGYMMLYTYLQGYKELVSYILNILYEYYEDRFEKFIPKCY